MNVQPLLLLIPLIVGIAWLFYLVFRADLASKPIGQQISYFLGVLIILIAVGWFVTLLLPNWLSNIVTRSQQSAELQEFTNDVTDIIENVVTDAPSGQIQTQVIPAPTTVSPLVPASGTNNNNALTAERTATGQAGTHIVQTGETLTTISEMYGVTVQSLREANNRFDDWIYVGESLVIPGVAAPAPATTEEEPGK